MFFSIANTTNADPHPGLLLLSLPSSPPPPHPPPNIASVLLCGQSRPSYYLISQSSQQFTSHPAVL